MVWNALTFSDDNILTGSEMNSLQDNFSAMAAGNSGSPAIATNSLVATGVASLTSIIVSSLFTAEVVSAKQITVDSGIQADVGSFNQLEVNSLNVASGMNLVISEQSSKGYTYLPNGIIMQWGVESVTATAVNVYSFEIVFPNNIFSLVFTPRNTISQDIELTYDHRSYDTSGFAINNDQAANLSITYLAIGN